MSPIEYTNFFSTKDKKWKRIHDFAYFQYLAAEHEREGVSFLAFVHFHNGGFIKYVDTMRIPRA